MFVPAVAPPAIPLPTFAALSGGEVGLLAGVGAVGGFVNAIAGGGSLIVFPALVATGLPTLAANVTNSVALWPGYIGNVASLRGEIARQWREQRGRVAGAVGVSAVATVLGAILLLVTPGAAFDDVVPVLVFLATALLGFGPRLRARLGDGVERDIPLFVSVFVASVYGGYFGGGLGVILLAVLGLTYAGDLRAQNAIKALLQIVVSTAALVVFVTSGPIEWTAVAAVAPTALIGGVVGGRLTRKVSAVWLRRLVVAFGTAVGAWLTYRAVTG